MQCFKYQIIKYTKSLPETINKVIPLQAFGTLQLLSTPRLPHRLHHQLHLCLPFSRGTVFCLEVRTNSNKRAKNKILQKSSTFKQVVLKIFRNANLLSSPQIIIC